MCMCVYLCVLAKSLWKGLNLLLTYLISTHSNQSCPQEHSSELIREEGEVKMHGRRKHPNIRTKGKEMMKEKLKKLLHTRDYSFICAFEKL